MEPEVSDIFAMEVELWRVHPFDSFEFHILCMIDLHQVWSSKCIGLNILSHPPHEPISINRSFTNEPYIQGPFDFEDVVYLVLEFLAIFTPTVFDWVSGVALGGSKLTIDSDCQVCHSFIIDGHKGEPVALWNQDLMEAHCVITCIFDGILNGGSIFKLDVMATVIIRCGTIVQNVVYCNPILSLTLC